MVTNSRIYIAPLKISVLNFDRRLRPYGVFNLRQSIICELCHVDVLYNLAVVGADRL